MVKGTVKCSNHGAATINPSVAESTEMAGESLSKRPGSTLLFRADGRVAAGSSGAAVQERNMRSIGMSDTDLVNLLGGVARSVLDTGLHVSPGRATRRWPAR